MSSGLDDAVDNTVRRGVFLNALPKAGTNLAAKALQLLGLTQRRRLSSDIVLGRSIVARAMRALPHGRAPGYLIGIDTPVEIARWVIDVQLQRIRPGTFCEAHVGYTQDLLSRVRELDLAGVVVIRDPRAVLNSFVHYVESESRHHLYREFIRLSREARFRVALLGGPLGRTFLQPLRVRCLALGPWLRAPVVLRLRFEDLVGPEGGGDAVVQRREIERLVEHIGADAGAVDTVASALFGPGRSTFRRGRVDSWVDEIPGALLAMVEDVLGDVLTAWGYA